MLRDRVRLGSKAKQLRMLEEHAQLARPAASGAPIQRSRTGRRTARLRLVLYFNPQMCVDQRIAGEAQRQGVEDLLADLNRRLRSERTRLDADGARFLLVERLAARSMLKVYRIRVESSPVPGSERQVPQLRVDFDEKEWLRRRRDRRSHPAPLRRTRVVCVSTVVAEPASFLRERDRSGQDG